MTTKRIKHKIVRRIKSKTTTNPLLEMAGIGKSKTGTLGQNVDEIYEIDAWVEKAVEAKKLQ